MTHVSKNLNDSPNELKRGDLVELVDGTSGQDEKVGWVGVVVGPANNKNYIDIRWMWGDSKDEGGFWPWRFRKIGEADLAD